MSSPEKKNGAPRQESPAHITIEPIARPAQRKYSTRPAGMKAGAGRVAIGYAPHDQDHPVSVLGHVEGDGVYLICPYCRGLHRHGGIGDRQSHCRDRIPQRYVVMVAAAQIPALEEIEVRFEREWRDARRERALPWMRRRSA